VARLQRFSLAKHVHWVQVSVSAPLVMVKDHEDLQDLWSIWCAQSESHKVGVHAYLFDPNKMTALVTPSDEHGVGALMQSVGRQYVQRFNRRHHRAGTLWSGRYRSVLVDASRWMLPLMTWMGSPERSGEPHLGGQTLFLSSEKHYAGVHLDALITPHPEVWRLGNTPFAREVAYTEMVHQGLSPSDLLLMKGALHSGWPLGGAEFVANLQNQTERRLSPAKRGRPRKPLES